MKGWREITEPAKDAYWAARRAGKDETASLLAALDVALADDIVPLTAEGATRPCEPLPDARKRRRGGHYDSQGYCDNPGRGY